jgi:hypothetical protein
VNRFIDQLQVVATNNYYTTADVYTTNRFTPSLFSLLSWVYTWQQLSTMEVLPLPLPARWLSTAEPLTLSPQNNSSVWTPRKAPSLCCQECLFLARYLAVDIYEPYRKLPLWHCFSVAVKHFVRCLEMVLHVTILSPHLHVHVSVNLFPVSIWANNLHSSFFYCLLNSQLICSSLTWVALVVLAEGMFVTWQ